MTVKHTANLSPLGSWTLKTGVAVGATTITLDGSPGVIDQYKGWLVVDPYTPECEIFEVTSVSGSVVTVTPNVTLTNTAVIFDGPTKTIRVVNHTTIRHFFDTGSGQTKIVVSGTTGGTNDGVYTVVSITPPGTSSAGLDTITVAETVTTQSTAASVTLKSVVNFAHSSGASAFFTSHDAVQVEWFGWKNSGSSTDATRNTNAWNRAMNCMYWAGLYNLHYPGGTSLINGQLWVEDGRHIWGPTEIDGTIKAASTFSPSFTTEVAMIHGRDNGQPCRYDDGSGSARIYCHNLKLHGGNTSSGAGSSLSGFTPTVAGSNGMLTSTQQPSDLESLRVDNCDGYGLCVSGTQQIDGERWQLILCRVGLILRSTAFVNVRGVLNIEKSIESNVRMEIIPGSIDNYQVQFAQLHIESHGILPSVAHFDIYNAVDLRVGTAYYGVQASSTVFLFRANSGKGGAKPSNYILENQRISGNPTTCTFINDTDRGQTLNAVDVWSAGQATASVHTAPQEAPTSTMSDGNPALMILGTGGGYVKLGAPNATSTYKTARMTIRLGDSNQRGILVRDSTGAEIWAIYPDGSLFLGNVAATPATPVAGSKIYAQAGATKVIGSSGSITTIGAA